MAELFLFDSKNVSYIPYAKGNSLWIPQRKFNKLEDDEIAGLEFALREKQGASSLYKYRSFSNPYHLKIIENLELYLSRYAQLNDPCEGNIVPRFDFSTISAKKYMHNFNKKFIQTAIRQFKGMTHDEFMDGAWFEGVPHLPLSIKDRVKDTLTKIGGLNSSYLWERYFYELLHPQIVNSSGVSSFSKDRTNALLWAHYGDSHYGFCVEFDKCALKADAAGSDREIIMGDVMYATSEDIVDPSSDEDALCSIILLTKTREWEYESEFRIISKKSFGVFKIRPTTIRSIYLGCRCSKENIDKIKSIVEVKLPHVAVYIYQKYGPYGDHSFVRI